ncbi:MAG: DNA primase [Oleiphilaceae bacterium]|nr:DNA primase [Oleiphilaceae bacterium]
MAGLIPQSFIDDLLARVPIAEVVATRVQLKKAGSSLKACCPFHQEKTPSFHVNTQKNFYHCFGCGANGNSINFLRDHDNLSFIEAVEELAKIAGVEVPREEGDRREFNRQKSMMEALDYASLRYREALKQHPQREVAQRYLKQRGLSDEVVERFAIGYAPAERDYLSGHCKADMRQSLLDLKMLSEKFERPFELFQNRLMFPIRNARGKTIAFGGRTLGDDKAKYINSPESEVFHKSREIYGLYEAMQANRQLEQLLVVEGYMDVVALAQFGIDYAVATLGTATNTESLGQLIKRCQHLVFCFDGDQAGLQAARKAMENALPLYEDGLQLRFLILPEGEDPDTLVRQEGAERFQARIDKAIPLSAFFFQIYSQGLDLTVAEQRGMLKQRAEAQIEKVASKVLKSALRAELNKRMFPQRQAWGQDKKPAKPAIENPSLTSTRVVSDPDTALCLALYYRPEQAAQILDQLGDASGFERSRQFASYLHERNLASPQDMLVALATDNEGYRARFSNLFDRLEWLPDENQAIEAAQDLLRRIEHEKTRRNALKAAKVNKLPSQLSEAEKQALKSLSRSRQGQ